MKVTVDAVIRRDLRQSARAAGKTVVRVNLSAGEIVIGIVESAAIGVHRFGAQNRVVHDAFHAVAVAGIAGHTQQVSRYFEVSVRSAGRLEAVTSLGKTGVYVVAGGRTQPLIGTPSTGSEALCSKHGKCVLRGAQIFLVGQGKVSLHRRTQGVAVAVGMFSTKNIFAAGERVEPGGVVEILNRQFTIAISRAALVSQK